MYVDFNGEASQPFYLLTWPGEIHQAVSTIYTKASYGIKKRRTIMGLYKIFKDVFYETMTRHDFIHQGNVFFRIKGKDIVQAVTIKPITGYEICVAIFPLCLTSHKGFKEFHVLPKKPYWAEDRPLNFYDRYAEFPHVICSSSWIENGVEEKWYSLPPFFNKENYLS